VTGPTVFDWPRSLVPADVVIRPPRKTMGLNTGLSENAQAVPSIRPPFGLTLPFGNLFGDKVLAYRALLASLEGRSNTVRVPLFDLWFRATDAQIGAGAVPHSDGTPFSDGALYVTDDLFGVTASGVQGQRMITVDFGQYGPLLQGGMHFGLGEYPYVAAAVWWVGTVATIRCTPTLRRAYTDEPLKLKPTMLCRLVDDDTGELRLTRGRYGAPTLDFVEDFRVAVS
jgi:hypothetical protein